VSIHRKSVTGLVDLLELAKFRERTSDGDPVLQRFPKNLAIGAVSQTKLKIISFHVFLFRWNTFSKIAAS
jgi:hypothetical protein